MRSRLIDAAVRPGDVLESLQAATCDGTPVELPTTSTLLVFYRGHW